MVNYYVTKKADEFLRVRDAEVAGSNPVVSILGRGAIDDLFGALRERGVDIKTGCVVFIVGGALLLREYLESSEKVGKCIFIEDICANAKGYGLLYQVQKPESEKEKDLLEGFDEVALNGIMESIAAFQNQ